MAATWTFREDESRRTPRPRRGYRAETSRRRGRDADIPWSRGATAAATWIFCGDDAAATAARNFGRRYEILGNFDDAWFGGALPIAPSFHLDARDAVGASDSDGLDAFYARHVAAPPADEVARQVAAGVLRRVGAVRAALGGAADVVVSEVAAAPAAPPPAPAAPNGTDFSSEKAWILGAAARAFL